MTEQDRDNPGSEAVDAVVADQRRIQAEIDRLDEQKSEKKER